MTTNNISLEIRASIHGLIVFLLIISRVKCEKFWLKPRLHRVARTCCYDHY